MGTGVSNSAFGGRYELLGKLVEVEIKKECEGFQCSFACESPWTASTRSEMGVEKTCLMPSLLCAGPGKGTGVFNSVFGGWYELLGKLVGVEMKKECEGVKCPFARESPWTASTP